MLLRLRGVLRGQLRHLGVQLGVLAGQLADSRRLTRVLRLQIGGQLLQALRLVAERRLHALHARLEVLQEGLVALLLRLRVLGVEVGELTQVSGAALNIGIIAW